jgi:hypothetical protein
LVAQSPVQPDVGGTDHGDDDALLLDGFAGRVAASDDFVAEREIRTLNEQVASLLGNRPSDEDATPWFAREADEVLADRRDA